MKILDYNQYAHSSFVVSQDVVWVYCWHCRKRYLKRIYEPNLFPCCNGFWEMDKLDYFNKIIVLCS